MLKSGLLSLAMLLFTLWLAGGLVDDTFIAGALFVVLWAACWLFVYQSFFKGKEHG